jgi:hypothetical protein
VLVLEDGDMALRSHLLVRAPGSRTLMLDVPLSRHSGAKFAGLAPSPAASPLPASSARIPA